MTSLKARLTSLFSPALGECLQTSKEFRRQVRDRVLEMLEEEIKERTSHLQTGSNDNMLGRYGISLPQTLETSECNRCINLKQERDDAVVASENMKSLAEKYKQQISQLKEITKHHRAMAEGTLKLSEVYPQTASNYLDGTCRSDLLKEREKILMQNNKMMQESLQETESKLAESERSLKLAESELKERKDMVETLRKELQLTAHTVIAERKNLNSNYPICHPLVKRN
jgi:hypothetical protein